MIDIEKKLDTIQFRLAEKTDADACVEFHNLHWSRKINTKQWLWQCFPFSINQKFHFTVIAEINGKIIGTQSIIPTKFIDSTGIYLTAKSEQTLLSKEVRGKGIFSKMYDLEFKHCLQNDIKCIWGYTQAGKAFEKIDFKIPFKSRQVWKGYISFPKIKFSNFKSALKSLFIYIKIIFTKIKKVLSLTSINLNKKIEIKKLSSVPFNIEELSKKFINQWGGATIFRDKNFISWRFLSNPYVNVNLFAAFYLEEILGYIAVSLPNHEGVCSIVDIITIDSINSNISSKEVSIRLFKEAIDFCKKEKGIIITCWGDNNHQFGKEISEIYSLFGMSKFKMPTSVVHYVLPDFKSKNQKNLLSYENYKDWYVSMAFMQGHSG
ncbi:hypothetical protein OAK17_02890 [Alphaproteobacteria bacterium]|nr:hypothetical protein [Alphaproteobacteria bacterium]